MGTDQTYTLNIVIAGREAGAKEATQVVQRGLTDVGAAQQVAASGFLALSQAQARYEVASGNAAGAVQRLTTVIAAQDTTTAQTIGAQTQLAQLQSRMANEVLSHARAEASLAQAMGEPERAAQILGAALAQQTERTTQVINAERQLIQVQQSVGDSGGQLEQIMTGAYRRIGEVAVNAMGNAVQAVGQFIADGVAGTSEYQSNLNLLGAVSGATAEQLAEAGTEAKALGGDMTLPATSAGSAATAMTELAKAGLNVENTLSAAKGTLQLAAAGNISEAQSAELAAAALNEFHLEGTQATRVADLLAASVAASGSAVTQTGGAVQQAGASYAAAKVPIQDFVTLVNEMAKSGIKGSDAGTSLKTMLQRLQAPTSDAAALMHQYGIDIYDAQGAMLPMRNIIGQFSSSLGGLTQEQRDQAVVTIFGSDAQRAANIVLAGGTAAYDQMHAAVTRQNAAADLAGARMAGLGGAAQGLQSQLETLTLEGLEPLLPLMEAGVRSAAEFAGSFVGKVGPAVTSAAQFLTRIGETIGVVAQTVQAYGIPAVVGLTAATVAYGIASGAAAIGGIQNLGVALALVGQRALMAIPGIVANGVAVAAAVAPYAAIALAIGGVVKAWQYYNDQVNTVTQKVLNSSAVWRDGTAVLEDYHKASQVVQDGTREEATKLEILRAKQEQLVRTYAENVTAKERLGVLSGITTQRLENEQRVINALGDEITKSTAGLKQHAQALAAATSGDAIEQAHQLAAAHGQLAHAVAASDAEIAKANKDIEKAGQEGTQALQQATQTTNQFLTTQAAQQQAHEQKLLDLKDKFSAAKTAKERAAIGEQIAAENTGFAEQSATAATAYAAQEAQQRQHLGQELIDYVQAQAVKNSAFRDKADELTGAIAEQFGVQQSLASAHFGEMLNAADGYLEGTSSDAEAVAQHLGQVTDAAATTKQHMDELNTKFTMELIENTPEAERNTEAYLKKLNEIPKRVNTIVEIEARLKSFGGSGSIGRNVAAGGGTFMTSGPTTLTVGDNPGGVERVTVTPISGRGETRVGHNMARMAGGGVLFAGGGIDDPSGSDAPPPVSGSSAGSSRRRRGPDPLKEQQKLNNSLLANQQKADQQFENLEVAHLQKLQKIDQDFAKKELAQQQANEIGKRRSRYSFYKSISDLDVASQQQLAAQYEQAAGEARAMDAAGNKKEAADYLAMRQSQIEGDKDYLAERKQIAEDSSLSKKEKDAALKHLDDLDAMRKDAEREELDQLKARGDDIQNEHQQQIADEQAAYEQGQAKIVVASDQAADRKISNAQRSGTAINAENDALREQIRLLGQVGSAGGGGGTGAVPQARASGGPVVPGADYLVGENGPELVRFGAPGTVIPTGQTQQLVGQNAGGGGGAGGSGAGLSGMGLSDAIINALLASVRNGKAQLAALKQYAAIVEQTARIVSTTEAIRAAMAEPQPLLDPRAIQRLAEDTALVTTALAISTKSQKAQVSSLKQTAEASDQAARIVNTLSAIRAAVAEPQPLLDPAAIVRLAEDTTLVMSLLAVSAKSQKLQVKQLKQVGEGAEQAAAIVNTLVAIRAAVAEPAGPISPESIIRLADDANTILRELQSHLLPATKLQNEGLKLFAETEGAAVGILKDTADLGRDLKDVPPAIDAALVRRLVTNARAATQIVLSHLLPATKQQSEGLKSFAETEGAAVGILKDTADLGRDLKDVPPAISVPLIQRLTRQSREVARIMVGELGPASTQVAASVKTFQETEGAAVGILKDTADLGRDLKDVPPAISVPLIQRLSANARLTANIVAHGLIPASAAVVAGVKTFQETEGAAVGILKDTAELGRDLTNASPAIDVAMIQRLSGEARTIANIVAHGLIPSSEAQSEGVKRWAETEGAAVSALKNVLDLSGNLFTDYRSPSDAQLNMVVGDARRITSRMVQAARLYKKDGLEGAKLYAEAFGGTVSAFKDQLLFIDALNSGDFVMNPQKLAQFEAGATATMEVARRLGVRAASIPSTNLNALARITTLLKDEAEALIRLAAVPTDDLQRAAQGLAGIFGGAGGGGGGGGGAGSTPTIVFEAGAIQVDARGTSNPYEVEATHRRAAEESYRELAYRLASRRG